MFNGLWAHRRLKQTVVSKAFTHVHEETQSNSEVHRLAFIHCNTVQAL